MSGHYFEPTPQVDSEPVEVRLVLPDMALSFEADRGVFSARGVDRGTEILLRHAPHPPATGNILDLGCGYGPIAVALGRRSPRAIVWAVDVNERALGLAERNATLNGATNVVVRKPEDVPDVRFTALYCNPPIRIGKAALHELLLTWLARLDEGASAWLVVHRHLGSDSLARWLTGAGWAVERHLSKEGYRVLRVARG